MRCAPLALLLVLLPSWVFAQEFDPLIASERGAHIDYVRPLIERDFGKILEHYYLQGTRKVPEEESGPASIIYASANGKDVSTVFLFCDGRLSGVNGAMTEQQFQRIFYGFKHQPNLGLEMRVMYSQGEITLLLPTSDAIVHFRGIGSESLSLTLSYPDRLWSVGAYERHCLERTYLD